MGRTVRFDVNLDDLSEELANTWHELLDEADFFELPENLKSKDIPDGFTYHITVESTKINIQIDKTSGQAINQASK